MTKQELIKALEQWPDDAKIEVGVPANPLGPDPIKQDKVWLNISMVEDISLDPKVDNTLCLLFCDQVTMS